MLRIALLLTEDCGTDEGLVTIEPVIDDGRVNCSIVRAIF